MHSTPPLIIVCIFTRLLVYIKSSFNKFVTNRNLIANFHYFPFYSDHHILTFLVPTPHNMGWKVWGSNKIVNLYLHKVFS